MSYQDIEAGTTERFFTVVARVDGSPIIAGTVNYYLKCKSGANDGKWWADGTQTWEVGAQANAMSHEDDGHWEIDLTSTPFVDGVRYHEYVKESGDLHVPDGRHLIGRTLIVSDVAGTAAALHVTTDALLTGIQGATFNTVTDSLEAIRNQGDASWLTAVGFSTHDAAAVWAYSSRTLTQTATQVISALVSGSTISVVRGDTLTIVITGLGSIVDRTNVWFTVKRGKNHQEDSSALLQIDTVTGLLYFEGQIVVATDASIAVDDDVLGNITITIKPGVSIYLPIVDSVDYDVQVLRTDDTVNTLTSGTFTVVADSTRRIV